MMLTIYTEEITARHEYIFGFIFQDILGLDIRLTADEQVAMSAQAVLNYSTKEIEDRPYMTPHGLLAETGFTSAPRIHVDELSHFFPVDSDILDFDLFSAAFYLLSRYEEYAAPESDFDEHGRFRAIASLASRDGFLNRPLIDVWAQELKKVLGIRFPDLIFRTRRFSYLSTFDIDVAYAYGGRGGLRELGSRIKDISKMDTLRMKERSAVLSGKKHDPYDTYDYLLDQVERNNVESRFFFLLGDRGPLDRNLPYGSELMTSLIRRLDGESIIGIHPSMGSHAGLSKLKKEIYRLHSVTGTPVRTSRQHFLSFRLPETFQRLEKAGIGEDYSMAYAEQAGFRASTCTPHQWYDLSQERISDLRLIPLTIMDSTLKDYLKLSPDNAQELVDDLIAELRSVNGLFVSLWHNHSLNDQGEWQGWRTVFEAMITMGNE